MSEQVVYNTGDYLRAADSLIQDIVAASEDLNKLDGNPASPTNKKRVVLLLSEHIVQTRNLIEKINSVTKTE